MNSIDNAVDARETFSTVESAGLETKPHFPDKPNYPKPFLLIKPVLIVLIIILTCIGSVMTTIKYKTYYRSKAAEITNIKSIKVCSEMAQFNKTNKDVSAMLQKCLDNSLAGEIVELPPGKYVVAKQIKITKPIMIRTQNKTALSPRCNLEDVTCAEIIADKNLVEPWGVVYVETNNLTLDHIIINGNNKERLNGPAGGYLAKANTGIGHNLMVMSCNGCVFSNNVLKNGLSATAFGYNYVDPAHGYQPVNNHDTVIKNNLIANNGIHNRTLSWSDGFSFHDGNNFTIVGNEFVNNTDIDFIMGGCTNCSIERNKITHTTDFEGGSFAAMNFQAWVTGGVQSSSGDFTGSTIANNIIDCSSMKRCGFGLYLGSKAWGYTAKNLKGGIFKNNTIRNAQQGFQADTYQNATFSNNIIENNGGKYKTNLGFRQMNNCNITPDASIQFINNNIKISGCTNVRWDNPAELPNSWATTPTLFDSVVADSFVKYGYYYMLGRPANTKEVSQGIQILNKGTSRSTFLYNLYITQEFKLKYKLSQKNNSDFLSFMYAQILHRETDPKTDSVDAFQTLLKRLNNNESRDIVGAAFFATPEIKQAFSNDLNRYSISDQIPTTTPSPVPVSPIISPTLAPTNQTTSGKLIKGAVFCYDKTLPTSTGQTRPIVNADVMMVQDGSAEQKKIATDQNGYFSFSTNLNTAFSLYVIGLSKAKDRNSLIGAAMEPYTVANADAALAQCTMNKPGPLKGLMFENCQASKLSKVTDGFAFVVNKCISQ